MPYRAAVATIILAAVDIGFRVAVSIALEPFEGGRTFHPVVLGIGVLALELGKVGAGREIGAVAGGLATIAVVPVALQRYFRVCLILMMELAKQHQAKHETITMPNLL